MSALEFSLFALRAAVLAAEAMVFGTLAVQIFSGRDVGQRLLAALFPTLAVLIAVWLLAQSASMAGNVSAVWLVLTASRVGHLAALRAVAWLACWAGWRWRGARVAILPGVAALALHSGAGHAAAIGDPWLLAAVLCHVLAACAWIGGLPALWLALDRQDAALLVARYTWFGLVCVLVVVVTALAQSLALAGGVVGLIGTDYGHTILVKCALLLVLLGLALRHRFSLSPRLPASLPALRRSVLIEAGIGLGVMIAASLLASLPPGAHTQPDWPFPWRFSLDLMQDDEFRREVTDAARAMGGAGLLVLLAILARRIRWLSLLAAAVIAFFAVSHFDLLLLPAVPTYYWQSTTGYTPASIAAGRTAYVEHCSGCHGDSGGGDGPQAKSLKLPPADLTAAHLWEHPDGELYWQISHGEYTTKGEMLMPGFGARLGDETIWSLIDFLHDNNPNKPAGGVPVGGHLHH